MAAQTFKNEGGQVHVSVAGDAEPVVVGPGESVTTDKEEVKTAFRKSGQFSVVRQATKSYQKKEND